MWPLSRSQGEVDEGEAERQHCEHEHQPEHTGKMPLSVSGVLEKNKGHTPDFVKSSAMSSEASSARSEKDFRASSGGEGEGHGKPMITF